MAFRSETARDEVFSGQSITDAFKGIFRMGGGWEMYLDQDCCESSSSAVLNAKRPSFYKPLAGAHVLITAIGLTRMTRIILSGATTAVSCGLGFSTLFAIAYRTAALPFLVSACLGFCIGSYGFYRDALAKAYIAVERYPLLLRLHMHANFPGERFDLWDVARMKSAFGRERLAQWRLKSMLLASWMTATPVLDRIMDVEEDAIVAAEVDQQAWKQ